MDRANLIPDLWPVKNMYPTWNGKWNGPPAGVPWFNLDHPCQVGTPDNLVDAMRSQCVELQRQAGAQFRLLRRRLSCCSCIQKQDESQTIIKPNGALTLSWGNCRGGVGTVLLRSLCKRARSDKCSSSAGAKNIKQIPTARCSFALVCT